MSILLEDHLPVVKFEGLNTDKPVVMGSTLNVTGAVTITGGLVADINSEVTEIEALTVNSQANISNLVLQNTVFDADSQNATPSISNILGGIVTHNSKTGAGTCTVPTGTAMSAGVDGVEVGSTIKWVYYNRGNQTVTMTPAADHTIVGGTAAVTTGKHVYVTSYCSAANTWVSFLTTLM